MFHLLSYFAQTVTTIANIGNGNLYDVDYIIDIISYHYIINPNIIMNICLYFLVLYTDADDFDDVQIPALAEMADDNLPPLFGGNDRQPSLHAPAGTRLLWGKYNICVFI